MKRVIGIMACKISVMLAVLFVAGSSLFAQDSKETMVYLMHSDQISMDQDVNKEAHILQGNVVFRHDSMYMYCDSALYYKERNQFYAYHNIKAVQGDTLFMYGDSLYYDGTKKLLRVRSNVRLINNELELVTNRLTYDRNKEIAYFYNHGTMYDQDNVLDANYGEYNTVSELTSFYGKVDLVNPDYELTSDTLLYNTTSKMAVIVSPAKITSQANMIDTHHAFFYTEQGRMILLDQSKLIGENQTRVMSADSIYYDSNAQFASAFGNVCIDDYENGMQLRGEYLYFNDVNDSVVVTDNALAVMDMEMDSLFIHADTFKIITRFYKDSVYAVDPDAVLDSVLLDSVIFRQFRGYNKAKGYKTDMQFIADSLVFDSRDSCLTMFKDPIVWNEDYQIFGEKIKAFIHDKKLDWIDVINQAMFVQQASGNHYNQISGRKMKAYFSDGIMSKTDVDGNVEIVFFPVDQATGVEIGMNTTSAPNLSAFFTPERTIRKLLIVGKSKGVLYPITQIPAGKTKLNNFAWFDNLRPSDKDDVFKWRSKNEDQKLKTTTTRKAPLPSLPSADNKKKKNK